MSRIDKQCPGDCATCALALTGEVDMVPCVLDQMFHNQRRIEKKLDELINKDTELNFAEIDFPEL